MNCNKSHIKVECLEAVKCQHVTEISDISVEYWKKIDSDVID